MAKVLPVGGVATVAINLRKGDEAGSFDLSGGLPVWDWSGPEGATLTVAEDGLSATLTHVGAALAAEVSGVISVAVPDVDLGAGVQELRAVSETIVCAIQTVDIGADAIAFTFTGLQDAPETPNPAA